MTKRDITLVRFYIKTADYVFGIGSVEKYELFEFPVNSAGKMCSNVWVNWQSLFGTQLQEAEIKGIKQPARIQCPFIPQLYNALRTKEVLVYKWVDAPVLIDGVPDPSQPDWYKVSSGVEDIHEEQRRMEFSVQRYEKN